MGQKVRGKPDGSGPHKDSYRRRVEKKTVGRKLAAGQKCPNDNKPAR